MPSKGRQRASRQAQLRKNNKKSGRKNKPVIDAKLSDPINDVQQPSSETRPSEVADSKPKTVAPKPVPQASRSSQNSGVLEYPYLRSELRQIGLTSGLIIVAVIALTFIPWS